MTTKIDELKTASFIMSNEKDNILDKIMDFFIEIDERIKLLNSLTNDQAIEFINKINTIYLFSHGELYEQYIYDIIIHSNIPVDIKMLCCNTLYDEESRFKYKAFYHILNSSEILPVPLQTNIFKHVMTTEENKEYVLEKFKVLLSNIKIECEYRYKIVYDFTKNETIKRYYLDNSYLHIFYNIERTRYKILSAQYLLNSSISKKDKSKIEKICLSFCLDTNLDYNLRADSADLMIRFGNKKNKETAKEIIILLGKDKTNTIYHDKQNIHDENIQEEVKKFLNSLSSIEVKLTMEEIQTKIKLLYCENEYYKKIKSLENETKQQNNLDKINASLLRIKLDQTKYENYELQTIFMKIWTIIQNSEHRETLEQRMIEELIDMADTCSSGHLIRLVNALNSFGVEFSFSVEKQFYASFSTKLINIIHSLPEQQQELITNELGWSKEDEKPEYNKLFISSFKNIIDGLREEYIPLIPEEKFNQLVFKSKMMLENPEFSI